jgi:sigma-B regulation protein RsbU (phosphoserine phosphatase)
VSVDDLDLFCCPQTLPVPTATGISDLCDCYPVEIASHHEPAVGPGGDILSIKALDRARLQIFQADLSGHCINAAFHAFCLHYVVESDALRRDTPALWLKDANQFLRRLLDPGEFATAFCAIIDFDQEELTYAAACSPAHLICNGDRFFPIDGSGYPLGIVPDATYENFTVPFPPGSALFVYSDALVETPAPPMEPVFTSTRLAQFLDGQRLEPATQIVSRIAEKLPERDLNQPMDDLIIVLLRHRSARA